MSSLFRHVGPSPEAAWIDRRSVAAMAAEADRIDPDETGGILLGYISHGHGRREAVIEAVTGPGPGASHFPSRFEPDGRWHRERVAIAYERSAGLTTYLGDWHSHPGGGPEPSGRDRRTAQKIARSRRARAPHPLMLIAWQRDDELQWRLSGLCWNDNRFDEIPLRVVDEIAL